MTEPFIRFEQVSKSFGSLKVIEDLNLDIARGEFVSLLGPSGSGKTTLLMMLAGFATPSTGRIVLDGQRIDDVPTHRRDMGVVFQNYALFPHMTVADNVAFPLRMRGIAKTETRERVRRALDMVQLLALSERRPAQLSGGQQQRVALARALVFEPRVVLMDEPLGALDKQLRERMQLDIRALHSRLGLTIVFVTHDQSEALTMSDRIAVFNKGRIEQIGKPHEIYDEPTTRFVAEFIGETNLAEGAVAERTGARARIALARGASVLAAGGSELAVGQPVLLSIRPERIVLSAEANGAANALPVRVTDSVYQGDHLRVQLAGEGLDLVARLDRKAPDWPVDATVFAGFDPEDCRVITP